ncbi:MAG: hypothetical protein WAM85_03095 [Terracidiphilus sp.]
MKTGTALTLSIAAFSLAFLSPNIARSQNTQSAETSQAATNSPGGSNEAMQMVPARAALIQNLDARRAKPGQEFRAKLSDTVHLKNGTELPHGTTLIGVVATDKMETAGQSRLALRLTQADLKDGKVVPIKATIVGVFPPEFENRDGNIVAPGDQQPNSWNSGVLQVDQIGALSGIDLHSKIAALNSGVFVSSKKDDVKLKQGSELTLAIAARANS